MKTKELRALNEQDLEGKTLEMKKELMKINSQVAVGTIPKNPSRIREIKKTIAKIYTIKNQNKGGSKKE